MKIVKSNLDTKMELPLELNISFAKVYEMFEKYAGEAYKEHPFHKSSKIMAEEFQKYPELIDGFSDFSKLHQYKNQIDLFLNPLFPEPLLDNEIKAASIPFSFTSFKFTNRFAKIIDNAGEDYVLTVRNFKEDLMYIMACTFILGSVYHFPIDIKRPFFFDIPDVNTGATKKYRVAFNADFSEITPTDRAPKITEEDYRELLDNLENIAIWKEKFPPKSYIFKGFGITNLFDVTIDETISSIRTNLLKKDDNLIELLQNDLREFFNIKDLMLGFSVFNIDEVIENNTLKLSESLLIEDEIAFSCGGFFCHYTLHKLFEEYQSIAISDVEKYGRQSDKNTFYKRMKAKGIGSLILIPIKNSTNKELAVLEIASPRPFELNSINQNKLKDVLPSFEAAVERTSEEQQNIIEATIQEHYTSLHPTVKWRFVEAAKKYQQQVLSNEENPKPEQIVFNDVYPLYGQSDIKGSSMARNHAIKEDLNTQLSLAIAILEKANTFEHLPIYEELIFRVHAYIKEIENGLDAGDEVGILDFLKQDIYPVFKHAKVLDKSLEKQVTNYINRLDPNLKVIYEKRKNYEESVTVLNDMMAKFIDRKQHEAQAMFPHYFERFKTDGVEYNMYIGQSLVKNKNFTEVYLYNLRLWQLQLTYQMENVAYMARKEMTHDLRVASLILVHSNSLAIRFRLDEKQFDVDGAYNIRYEIIKKRIDKAHIAGTTERLTTPGKIAIVYSQDKDAREYLKYIKYLQSQGQLGAVEMLELEDLMGVSGLKALRVEVIYEEHFNTKAPITLSQLLKEIES